MSENIENFCNNGCVFLEHGIAFDRHKVTDCCIAHHSAGEPMLIPEYEGDSIDWEKLFQTKQRRVNRHKKYPITECRDCLFLGSKEFDNEKYISHFAFSQIKLCNAKCIYCSDEYRNNKTCYDVYPIIKDLIDKGFHKPGGVATFQGGEPTLLQNFDELLSLLILNGTDARIHTSGIKYSPAITESLKNNKSIIVISLDCGTKEKYQEIKFVDKFDRVIENIKQYRSVLDDNNLDRIIIKYVITPGYNDSVEDVDNWLDLMEELKIKQLVLDVEAKYAFQDNSYLISPHVYMLYDYMLEEINRRNFKVLIYSFAEYTMNQRKIEKFENINNNKTDFVSMFNKIKNENSAQNCAYNIPSNQIFE